MTAINLHNNSKYFTDGQQVIDAVKQELLQSESDRPIRTLLLDFQMPKKNGLQVVEEVKKLYQMINGMEDRRLREPDYVFLSAVVVNKAFQDHCRKSGVEHFFEKPLDNEHLT